jgi:hypothetical protein
MTASKSLDKLTAERSTDSFGRIRSFIYVQLIAVCAGIFFPVTSSYLSETLYEKDVRTKLPPDADRDLAVFEQVTRSYAEAIRTIETRIFDATTKNDKDDVRTLILLHQHLKEQETALKPPYRIVGYYLDDIMPLWPGFYSCMGIIAFVLNPQAVNRNLFSKQFWTLLLLVTLFYRWPTWARNTPLGRVGRTNYTFANIDVSAAGFLTQEVMALMVSTLIVIVWIQWRCYWHSCHELRSRHGDPITDTFDHGRISRLQDLFLQWQIVSVVLVGAFAYYTYFFWNRVAVDGDVRFLAQAVSIHLLWIATWSIVSMPLMDSLREWTQLRNQAVAIIALRKGGRDDEALLAAIDRFQPISIWNLGGSMMMVLGSLLMPMVQAVKSDFRDLKPMQLIV